MDNSRVYEAEMTEPGKESRFTAIIAYFSVVGLVIAFFINTNRRTQLGSFHIRQSLGLHVSGFVLAILGMLPVIGWILNIVGGFLLLLLWFVGIIYAIKGEKKPVPLLGEKFEEWFKGI